MNGNGRDNGGCSASKRLRGGSPVALVGQHSQLRCCCLLPTRVNDESDVGYVLAGKTETFGVASSPPCRTRDGCERRRQQHAERGKEGTSQADPVPATAPHMSRHPGLLSNGRRGRVLRSLLGLAVIGAANLRRETAHGRASEFVQRASRASKKGARPGRRSCAVYCGRFLAGLCGLHRTGQSALAIWHLAAHASLAQSGPSPIPDADWPAMVAASLLSQDAHTSAVVSYGVALRACAHPGGRASSLRSNGANAALVDRRRSRKRCSSAAAAIDHARPSMLPTQQTIKSTHSHLPERIPSNGRSSIHRSRRHRLHGRADRHCREKKSPNRSKAQWSQEQRSERVRSLAHSLLALPRRGQLPMPARPCLVATGGELLDALAGGGWGRGEGVALRTLRRGASWGFGTKPWVTTARAACKVAMTACRSPLLRSAEGHRDRRKGHPRCGRVHGHDWQALCANRRGEHGGEPEALSRASVHDCG